MPLDIVAKSAPHFEENLTQDSRSEQSDDNPFSYENLNIVKRLDKGKFPISLANSKLDNHSYIVKVFSEAKNFDVYSSNEFRFACLKHPHIVNVVYSQGARPAIEEDKSMKEAYIVSEYAPHGDFFDFISNHRNEMDEKLARTYFRQLISGLEYLHSIGVSHLDLKLENLLIDADFNLRIADFDVSHIAGDERVLSRGTKYYRGPELYKALDTKIQLESPAAADIFSAGVILFVLKSEGIYPHLENQLFKDVNLTELMDKNSSKFWSKHCEFQGKPKDFFDSKFKDLFYKMVKPNPKQRYTIKKIKESKWYNGPVYTPLELYLKMKTIMKC